MNECIAGGGFYLAFDAVQSPFSIMRQTIRLRVLVIQFIVVQNKIELFAIEPAAR